MANTFFNFEARSPGSPSDAAISSNAACPSPIPLTPHSPVPLVIAGASAAPNKPQSAVASNENSGPRLAVFTTYMLGRGGDIGSAITFMKRLYLQDPKLKFDWIVKQDYLGVGKAALQARVNDVGIAAAVTLHFLCMKEGDADEQKRISSLLYNDKCALANSEWRFGWGQEFWGRRGSANDAIFPAMQKATAFCVVATLHRFSHADCINFREIFPDKMFYTATEYDYEFSYKNGKYANRLNVVDLGHRFAFSTGLGPKKSGVYLDEYMFSKDKLPAIVKTQPGEAFLLSYLSSEADYTAEKAMLFYSYFFIAANMHDLEDSTAVVRCDESMRNFARIAARNPKTKCVDIVIPTADKISIYQEVINAFAEAQLSEDLKNVKLRVEIIIQNDQLRVIEHEPAQEGGASNKRELLVKIIVPARLDKMTIQCLLNSSASACGLTGDQSAVEGLVKGKLVFYQAMKWKLQVLKSICQCCHVALGTNSLLQQFYELQFYKPPVVNHPENLSAEARHAIELEDKKLREAAWTKLVEFYIKYSAQLKEQAEKLAKYIVKNKDISKLFKTISTQLTKKYKEEKNDKQVKVSDKSFLSKKPSNVDIVHDESDVRDDEMLQYAFGSQSHTVKKYNRMMK